MIGSQERSVLKNQDWEEKKQTAMQHQGGIACRNLLAPAQEGRMRGSKHEKLLQRDSGRGPGETGKR